MSALGSLVVKLALDYAEYTKGLDRSDQASLKFASNAQRNFDQAGASSRAFMGGLVSGALQATAAVIGIGASISRLNASIDTMARIDDSAQKTGSSVESLSRIAESARAYGHSFDPLEEGITKLAKGMATVDSESNKTNKALAALGISSRDAAGKMREPAEVALEAITRLRQYEDSANKTALVSDLMGKSAANSLPAWNDVADSIHRFSGFSAEAAAEATHLQDQMNGLGGSVDRAFTSFAVDLLPTLKATTSALFEAGDGTSFFSGTAETAKGMIDQLVITGAAAGFVFATLGNTVTTVAKQLVALSNLDISGARLAGVDYFASVGKDYQAYRDFHDKILAGNKEIIASNAARDKPARTQLNYETGNDAAEKKISALNEASQKYLETLKNETLGVGASTIQTKLLAAAKQAAVTPSLELAGAIMAEAQAWAKLTQFQEEAKEQFAVLQEREDTYWDAANAVTEYGRATEIANESAAFEVAMMGKSGLEREIAIEQRKAELDLKRQILAINDQVTNTDDRAALTEQANAIGASAAAAARLQASAKHTATAWAGMWGSIEQTGKLAFVNLLGHGTSSFKSIGAALKASVIDLLYQLTARKWIISIGTSISGSLTSSLANAGVNAGVNSGLQSLLSGFGMTGGTAAASGASGSSLMGGTAGIVSAIQSGFSSLTGSSAALFSAFATSSVGSALGLSAAGGSALGAGVGIGGAGAGAGAGTAFIGGAGTALGGTGMTTAGLSTLGAGMAAMAGPLAIAMAVDIAARLMAGNKSISNSGAWRTASAIPIVGIIPNLINAFFGHGPRKYTGPQTLAGAFSGEGFVGDLQTPYKRKGGFFVKDKRGIEHQAITSLLDGMLDGMVTATSTAFNELASVAGTAGRSLNGFSFSINREMKTKEHEKELIKDLSNAVGAHLIPELVQLQQENEQLADTALRIRKQISVTNQLLDLTGASFGVVGLAAIGLGDRLVQLLGGVDNAASSLGAFYQSFYTGDEQMASGWRLLNAEMSRIGLHSLPTTRDGFRALVEAQDLSTFAGQEMFASLISLAPAFAKLTEEAVQAKAAITLLTTDSFSTLVDYTRYIRLAANAGAGPKPDEMFDAGALAAGTTGSNAGILEELRQLRAEFQSGNIAIAIHTAKTAAVLSRWEGDGMPEIRNIAA